MTILFLTSRIPYPPYRGDKLKIFNLIRELSPRHEIHLVSFFAGREEAAAVEGLNQFCHSIRLIRLPSWKSYLNCAAALLETVPFQVAYYRSREFHHAVAEAIDRHRPDIIHTHLIRMAPYALPFNGIPRVLDLTDAVSLYLQRFRDTTTSLLLRRAARVELERMMAYESIIEQYDCVLVCSDPDRRALLAHAPRASIELLPNGIDLQQFSTDGHFEPDGARIIMTGNMSYLPNADGARWLVSEVFPRVKQAVPQAKLYIVGQKPPRAVVKLRGEDVVVTGFVPDIRREYLKSAVAVSPIRFGAGTLNKVLEPMALGVPVVATSVGMDGLDLEPGRDYLRGDDAATFANAVIQLLSDQSLRQAVGRSAQEKIRSRFGWDSIALKLEQVYQTVLHGGSHGKAN